MNRIATIDDDLVDDEDDDAVLEHQVDAMDAEDDLAVDDEDDDEFGAFDTFRRAWDVATSDADAAYTISLVVYLCPTYFGFFPGSQALWSMAPSMWATVDHPCVTGSDWRCRRVTGRMMKTVGWRAISRGTVHSQHGAARRIGRSLPAKSEPAR